MFEVLRNPTIDQLETFKAVANVLFLLSATGVVVGVIFEGKKFSSLLPDEFGWKLLVASLGVELLVTVAIFGIDEEIARSQRAEIISLQRKLAPRDLTPDQQASISAAIRPYKGIAFSLTTYPGDPEPASLAAKVRAAVENGQWEFVQLNGTFLGVVSGVFVTVNETTCDSAGQCKRGAIEGERQAAVALVSALRAAGVAAALTPDENLEVNPKRIAIRVGVGKKP